MALLGAHRGSRRTTRGLPREGHGVGACGPGHQGLAVPAGLRGVAGHVATTLNLAPVNTVLSPGLLVLGTARAAAVGFHTWWPAHQGSPTGPHAPPPRTQVAAKQSTGTRSTKETMRNSGSAGQDTTRAPGTHPVSAPHTLDPVLWRMRTTVQDRPGALAGLCGALAEHGVDILALQAHPLGSSTVDEFLLRVPATLEVQDLRSTVRTAGGEDTWLERADTHDLVDAPTHVLGLAARTALDASEIPLALRELLGRCTVRSLPPVPVTGSGASPHTPVPPGGLLEETRLHLPEPSGGTLVVQRPYPPFTPTEFARAQALVDLGARLRRKPGRREVGDRPECGAITVRRVDTQDLPAAKAMHARCSPETLSLRYRGPVGEADRYLRHVLSPRFGRSVAVETFSGRIVALGHLLWDGEETEVALLVEDAWQRRGLGTQLLRRLLNLAVEARCSTVYAVAGATNTGMISTLRALGLPLDYQFEEGTVVISAPLAPLASLAADGRR